MALGQFDLAPIYSSSSSRAATDGFANENNLTYISKQFKDFLRNFRTTAMNYIYRDKLQNNIYSSNYSLEIDVDHINQFDSKLFDLLNDNPASVVNQFEAATIEYLKETSLQSKENNDISQKNFQILLLTKTNALSVRELNSKLLNRLIKVEGIVISISSLRSKAVSITIQCKGCKTKIPNIYIPNAIENYPLPKKCPTDQQQQQKGKESCPYDPFIILPDQSVCIDSQLCTIQEAPQSVPHGEMPRHLQIYLDRQMCDKISPGNFVLISGIYSIKNTLQPSSAGDLGNSKTPKNSASNEGIRMPYLKASAIETLKDGIAQSILASMSFEEEIIFKQLSQRRDLYQLLSRSIAPSIYGNEDIKKSILCLLFGGSRKQMPDSLLRRGDINLLLLGDPGTAKSQLLKFVEKCSPIGVYTSGKGSSAAGLTASVLRDSSSRGFVVEGGAMVLADGGVVCIDEFDKMREEDRVTIHEAMEQQTISIAKAGITSTLNTRCSVLAAANSVFGRWDDTKGEKNIDLMPTILSRFDMIYIIKDRFNDKRDTMLAKHVVDLHSDRTYQDHSQNNKSSANAFKLTSENVSTIQELDVNTLRKYISYCRTNCGPRLSEDAAKKLKQRYVTMRNGSSSSMSNPDDTLSNNKKNKYNYNNNNKNSSSSSSNNKNNNIARINQNSTIPITIRQLEALIRISESLAKMRLSAFTSDEDVDEAIRLFQVSTLGAAKSGKLVGVEGVTTTSDQSQLFDIEKQLRKRFIPGSQVAVKSILSDFANQNYPELLVQKVINQLVYRGEAQFNKNRTLIIRVK